MRRISLIGVVLAACGPAGGDDDSACTAILAGDLVITEVMANPDGEDTGNEWFEIHNSSGAAVSVAGLTLVASREDRTDEKLHVVRAGTMLGDGQYFVVGGVIDEVKPQHVDYGAGNDLGALRNEAGRLALRCGETLVDEVIYAATTSGKSQGLNGDMAPDAIANDDRANWCDATTEYTPLSFGTPREANDSCGSVIPPTMCDDGTGTLRATVPPVAGDLVITELMQNPNAAGDATGEWFEVRVERDLDLNGLEMGTTPGTVSSNITDPLCQRVVAGTHVLFARTADMVMNGGLPATGPIYLFDFGLTNSGGGLFVGHGGVVLDQVSWSTSGTGASTALDPARTNTTDNDDPLYWCPGTAAYGAGDLGTPGAINGNCPVVVPPGMCMAGVILRAIEPPVVNDLVLTEFMANPAAVSDAAGEWFEVAVTRDVDLNGLEIGTTVAGGVKMTLSSADCLRVTTGTRLVFAAGDDMALNGGIPAVNYVITFGLVNSTSGLYLGVGGAVLDAITWATTTSAASTQLDPDFTDPVGNDTAANFCATAAGTTYGLGDRGTPGAVNPQCP